MFSNGQMVFGIIFLIIFIVVLFFAYKEDIEIHRRYYKGSFWVLIAFILFFVFIAAIKFIFMG